MEESRGLAISISFDLIEEVLKKYVKNVPEDLKYAGVEEEWHFQSVKFYFKSEKFPIVKDQLNENAVTGKIWVTTGKKGKPIKATLEWRDPDKKEKK